MTIKKVLSEIKKGDYEYVDMRFTDPRGKLQHVTVMASEVDEGFLKSGWMFDGSSIAGWKSINESDMKLMPDLDSGYLDPFYSEKTYCLHCNVVEPESGKLYGRDPRSTAVKAEEYLKKTKIGTKAFFWTRSRILPF
jgi:glutamine synthetase